MRIYSVFQSRLGDGIYYFNLISDNSRYFGFCIVNLRKGGVVSLEFSPEIDEFFSSIERRDDFVADLMGDIKSHAEAIERNADKFSHDNISQLSKGLYMV